MMIDISGDVIYFDGHPVGIVTVPNGTLRANFEESIDCYGPDDFEMIETELEEEIVARENAENQIVQALKYISESENVLVSKIIEILS